MFSKIKRRIPFPVALVGVGLIAAILSLSAWIAYRQVHSDERDRAASSYEYQRFTNCLREGRSAALCRAALERSPYEESGEYYDLKAQQEMAEWALIMLIVTSVGIGFVAMTLKTASEANDRFQVSAEHQLRAYLSATPVDFFIGVKLNEDFPQHVDVRFKVNVKNHGQTPAYNVQVWANIAYDVVPIPEGYADRFAERLTHNEVVNPGQTKQFSFAQSVLFSERGLWETPPKSFILCGVVHYKTFDVDRYARFAGQLSHLKDWWVKVRGGIAGTIDIQHAEHGNDSN